MTTLKPHKIPRNYELRESYDHCGKCGAILPTNAEMCGQCWTKLEGNPNPKSTGKLLVNCEEGRCQTCS